MEIQIKIWLLFKETPQLRGRGDLDRKRSRDSVERLTRDASVPLAHNLLSNKQTTPLNPVVASAAKSLLRDNMKIVFNVEKKPKRILRKAGKEGRA